MAGAQEHTYEQLAEAVSAARSWRGVLRAVGRPESSAGALRAVRRQVDAFGIDHAHFTGQRRWSDRQLAEAVSGSSTWADVAERLGLADSGTSLTAVRGHALRLGLRVDHLSPARPRPPSLFADPPRRDLLRVAAGSLAAAWFQLRGYSVLWPQEPCRYDFVAAVGATFERVQVKSTTGTHLDKVSIAATRQDRKSAYDPDEVDHFFVMDGELNAYLIPIGAVAGLAHVSLRAYECYRVAERGNWLDPPRAGSA